MLALSERRHAGFISFIDMLLAARNIGEFIDRNPAPGMLSLSFLILIGCVLVAEGFDVQVPKGDICFAMAVPAPVEILCMRLRARKRAIRLSRAISDSLSLTLMACRVATSLVAGLARRIPASGDKPGRVCREGAWSRPPAGRHSPRRSRSCLLQCEPDARGDSVPRIPVRCQLSDGRCIVAGRCRVLALAGR